jgi:hypothetical protein
MEVRPLCRPGAIESPGKKAWGGASIEAMEAGEFCNHHGYRPEELIWHSQNALNGITSLVTSPDTGNDVRRIDFESVVQWTMEFIAFSTRAPRMLGVSIDDGKRRDVSDLPENVEMDERWLPVWAVVNAWGPDTIATWYSEPDVASWMRPSDVLGCRPGTLNWKTRILGVDERSVPWVAIAQRIPWTEGELVQCGRDLAARGVQHLLVYVDERANLAPQWDLVDVLRRGLSG